MIRLSFVLGAVLVCRAAAAQEPCVASAPQVVDDVYKQVLQRPADAASAGLANGLGSGQMTVRDVVATVARSPEYEARFFWPPIVSGLYQQIMQRQASAGEVEVASAALANGTLTTDRAGRASSDARGEQQPRGYRHAVPTAARPRSGPGRAAVVYRHR